MPDTIGINLKDLSHPFDASEIEWRVGQCGKNERGIWATCLAYVSARAIMDRLDYVCGPENWKASYRIIGGEGVICELSIRTNEGDWVTKEDGAEKTEIESFKGGISSALKRAGSVWGIGRYLYGLDQGFATIVPSGGNYGKTKDGTSFHWKPPALPAWALPAANPAKPLIAEHTPVQNSIAGSGGTAGSFPGGNGGAGDSSPASITPRWTQQPGPEMAHMFSPGEHVIGGGKLKGLKIKDMYEDGTLSDAIEKWKWGIRQSEAEGKQPFRFMENAVKYGTEYIAAQENHTPEGPAGDEPPALTDSDIPF